MKSYKKIILGSLISLLCLISNWAYSETLEDLAKEVSNIQAELKSLPTSTLEEAMVIDSAIKVIDQAANLVTESINKGDAAAALSTINYLNKSISDISSQAPKDFITEKTESDLTTFSKDDMKEIQTITQSMKSRKQEKMQTLVQDMVLVNENGVDAFKISKELNTIGVETITPEQVMEVAKTINTSQVQSLTQIKTVTEGTNDIKPEDKFSAFVGNSKEEVSMSLREVEALKSGDNAKQRAFNIEKYGKMVGLSDEEITQGVAAVKEGDWDKQKETLSKIYKSVGIEVSEEELNAEIEDEMVNDVALNAIMNGKGKTGEELAQEVKSILSKNKSISETTIERVYYTVKGGIDNVWQEPGKEISYNDIAAEAKAEMSEDPDVERAFYATQQGTDWSKAFEGSSYLPDSFSTEKSDIEVAAEVAAIMSGDNDKQVEFYSTQSTDWSNAFKDNATMNAAKAAGESALTETDGVVSVDWSNAFKDNATMNAAAEAAKEASSETTEAVAEVAQEAAAETTEAVAEVAQEAAAETTEAVAEITQEVAAEVSQEINEVAQEVAEEVQVASSEIQEEVKSAVEEAKDDLAQATQDWRSAQEEFLEVAKEVNFNFHKEEFKEASKKHDESFAALKEAQANVVKAEQAK